MNGLVGVTTSTLEKRFDLSSKQASLIPSAYAFAGKCSDRLADWLIYNWICTNIIEVNLSTKILEVNLFAFAYRLFHRDFYPLNGAYCNTKQSVGKCKQINF